MPKEFSKKSKLVWLFAYSLYFVAVAYFYDYALMILNWNLPFREAYFPTVLGIVFVYIVPAVLGYILTRENTGKSFLYFINLSLMFSVLYLAPLLLQVGLRSYWFDNHAILFAFLFVPIVFLAGGFINLIRAIPHEESEPLVRVSRKDLGVAFLLAASIFALNLIPAFYSDFLVGADVHYHAAMTQRVLEGGSISANPFFLNERNYYYSIVYWLMAFISKFSGFSVLRLWLLYVPFVSGVFIFFFYLFSRKAINSRFGAILASLFVFPLNQILWSDPSVRNLSYSFFAIFLLCFQTFIESKKKIYLLLSLIFYAITAASHPEIALHITAVIFMYTAIVRIPSLRNLIFNFFKKRQASNPVPGGTDLRNFLWLLIIFLLIIVHGIMFLLQNFSISRILVFNEVALSLFNPIGPISFLVFILAPAGIVFAVFRNQRKDWFLLSLVLLALDAVFYFSHLWTFFHRYFVETAYIGLSVLSARVFVKLIRFCDPYKRKVLVGVVLAFFLLSLWPKFLFIRSYSQDTSKSLAGLVPEFELIKNNTAKDAVIFVNPGNILNRYIPFYTNRYIFAGASEVTKEQQWQVLSFCNGPYAPACNRRSELAFDFFQDPSQEKLNSIAEFYKLDYLLLNIGNGEEEEILGRGLNLTLAGRDEAYALYKINL